MLTILNTSILTNFGQYRYEPIDLAEAKLTVRSSVKFGNGVQSAVGHAATATILTELLEHPVPLNRIEYRQQIGDRAIVFKLKGRVPEGVILSREEIEAIGYEFGLLTRIETKAERDLREATEDQENRLSEPTEQDLLNEIIPVSARNPFVK